MENGELWQRARGNSEIAVAVYAHYFCIVFALQKYTEPLREEVAAWELLTKLKSISDEDSPTTTQRVHMIKLLLTTLALRLDPGNASAYNNRGEFYREKGSYDQAIADYNQALRLDPSLAVAYNNRGLAYWDKSDYDQAIADCTEALRLDPENAVAYNNRGLVYCSKGRMIKRSPSMI